LSSQDNTVSKSWECHTAIRGISFKVRDIGYRIFMMPTLKNRHHTGLQIHTFTTPTVWSHCHKYQRHNLMRSQQIVTHCILPKLGYNRHMPSAVVYAPTHFGGIGLSDMSTEQGLAHVMFIVGHLRAKSDIATTITALFEAYMIATDTTTNPLKDHQQYDYVNAPWIERTKIFLNLANAIIETLFISHPILLRQRDQAIMAIATKLRHNTAQMLDINACRVWLQVTTIADITDISGTKILHQAMSRVVDQLDRPLLWLISTSKMQWPLQDKPGKQSWKV
jgi:hypothetical protein